MTRKDINRLLELPSLMRAATKTDLKALKKEYETLKNKK